MLIKKYGNRRLYDTESSRYITLEELAGIIRRGEEVRVVDAKSGEDLTTATLAQIIIEGRGAARLLPLPLLVQLDQAVLRGRVDRPHLGSGPRRPLHQHLGQVTGVGTHLDHRARSSRVQAGQHDLGQVDQGMAPAPGVGGVRIGFGAKLLHERASVEIPGRAAGQRRRSVSITW